MTCVLRSRIFTEEDEILRSVTISDKNVKGIDKIDINY